MADAALKSLFDTPPSVIDALKNTTEEMPHVTIYTDGACSGNPGPGGWGAVLMYNGMMEDLFDGEPATTNNRMEMMAAIASLTALPRKCVVDLYTDSTYVRDGIKTWMHNWKKNGWMTADKKPVKNQDLWQILDTIQHKHIIQWHWVKGHSGHPMNDRADDLARSASLRQAIKF
jgi:ribonuclease HI